MIHTEKERIAFLLKKIKITHNLFHPTVNLVSRERI